MYSVLALLGLHSVVDLWAALVCPVRAARLCSRQTPHPTETVFDIAFDSFCELDLRTIAYDKLIFLAYTWAALGLLYTTLLRPI